MSSKPKMNENRVFFCDYCGTKVPENSLFCLACGAPFTHPESDLELQKRTPSLNLGSPEQQDAEFSKAAEQVDEAYFKIMNVYTVAWRTVGEAIAITISAFIIGMVGAVTQRIFWGIVGAAAIGIAVGLTRKNFYLTLLSAPIGTILGICISTLFFITGKEGLVVFIVSFAAILGAILGVKPPGWFGQKNVWEKARPYLGALGGLGFGILGSLLGSGIKGILTFLSHFGLEKFKLP